MTEFVKIDENTFLLNSIVNDGEAIAKKISNMLDTFACFHDYSSFQSYKVKKQVHHNHHHQQPQRKRITNVGKTYTEREITALLNKISKRSYENLSKNIVRVVTKDNAHKIISYILENCQRQPSFLELYMNIIKDVSNNCSVEVRNTLLETLGIYIQDFIDEREFTNFKLDSKDYHEFCENMDNKTMILGKHRTIISIMVHILKNNIIDEYFNMMFNEVIQLDKNLEEDDREKHELLLDILGDFARIEAKYKRLIQKYYSAHQETYDKYTSKSKFKVLDIIEKN
jgi:hypothetical protein